MTTPQSELYNLSRRIYDLTKLFEGDEDEDSIFEVIRLMRVEMQQIATAQLRQENMMHLIISLLNKREEG
jgi:hypothetical protein